MSFGKLTVLPAEPATRPRDAAEVHANHARFVWTSLSRLGVRTPDLEDMTQEVFLVVHRRLPEFDGRSTITTWLFGICLRVASTYRRTARRKPTTPLDQDDEDTTHAPDPPPDRVVHSRELAAEMARFLEALEPEHRALFVMFEVEGISGAEIAAVFGLKPTTVYTRLHAIRQEFARALEAFERGEKRR